MKINEHLVNVVHDLVHEIHMESLMNSHDFFMSLIVSIQSIACSRKFMINSFMNFDELLLT